MALGIGWSQLLWVLACGLIFSPTLHAARLVPAVGLIGAGCFVAMSLVFDQLLPDAMPSFVIPAKLLCVLVFYTASGLTLYGVLTGCATMLFFSL